MSFLNKNQTISLRGEDTMLVHLPVRDVLQLDGDDRIGQWYDLNRGFVWNKQKVQSLMSSLVEGIVIPQIYVSVNNRSMLNGVNPSAPTEVNGQTILNNILDDVGCEVKIVDGLQRTTSILEFVKTDSEYKTEPHLEVNGRNVGRMTFNELPADVQDKILNYKLAVVFYFGDDAGAETYFHRLNSGVSLTAAEYTNAYTTPVCNWIRARANVHSPNAEKFKSFICDRDRNSKLLRIPYGRRMVFDKVLKQAVTFSAHQAGVINGSGGVSKDAMVKLSKQTWENLNEVPTVQDAQVTVDLKGEVESIFAIIDDVVSGPRSITKVGGSLLLNLYMFLHDLAKNGETVSDPATFSREFFDAHEALYQKHSSDYNEIYELRTRRGHNRTELAERVSILKKYLVGKDIGVTPIAA